MLIAYIFERKKNTRLLFDREQILYIRKQITPCLILANKNNSDMSTRKLDSLSSNFTVESAYIFL